MQGHHIIQVCYINGGLIYGGTRMPYKMPSHSSFDGSDDKMDRESSKCPNAIGPYPIYMGRDLVVNIGLHC